MNKQRGGAGGGRGGAGGGRGGRGGGRGGAAKGADKRQGVKLGGIQKRGGGLGFGQLPPPQLGGPQGFMFDAPSTSASSRLGGLGSRGSGGGGGGGGMGGMNGGVV